MSAFIAVKHPDRVQLLTDGEKINPRPKIDVSPQRRPMNRQQRRAAARKAA